MCGNHRSDGTPVDHHHHHGVGDGPIFMPTMRGPRQHRSPGPKQTWGGISAQVLAGGTEVAIVDTGLADIGLNYSNVTHIFLTHLQSDHIGSNGEVMDRATNATAYAGDAMVTTDGGGQGPAERFAKNLDQAHESVRRLAGLSYNTLLVGHGDPIEDRADTAVAAMAAAL